MDVAHLRPFAAPAQASTLSAVLARNGDIDPSGDTPAHDLRTTHRAEGRDSNFV